MVRVKEFLAECSYTSNQLLMWLLTLTLDSTFFSKGKGSGSDVEVKMQSRCQARAWFKHLQKQPPWIRVGPRRLKFPLGLNLQTSLATSYWFFIRLNIALPLIEFTPCYQCLKESCPLLPAPPRWSLFTWRRTSNLPRRSSTPASSLGRDDMEADHRGKNEICVSSTLDKNQEQQRWVTSCFTLLPWAFKLTDNSGIIYDYVPHLSVRHCITVLVYQCRWRSINSTCKFKNMSFQP